MIRSRRRPPLTSNCVTPLPPAVLPESMNVPYVARTRVCYGRLSGRAVVNQHRSMHDGTHGDAEQALSRLGEFVMLRNAAPLFGCERAQIGSQLLVVTGAWMFRE